jgi:hypothetical protein
LSHSNISQALQIAGVNGVNAQLNIPTIHSNIAPRLGFAYSVTPTTVLRGGYGLSYFPGNYTSNADLKNAPFTSVYSPACQSNLAVQIEESLNGGELPGGQNPACGTIAGVPGTMDQGLPTPVAPNVSDITTITGLTFTAMAPNFRPAMIQQFNLQVEQQYHANVLTLGYVGNIGQHLPESINNINQPAPFSPFTSPAGSSARPLDAIFANPTTGQVNLAGVGYMQSEGISNYNALQTSFQRRFNHGLAFDANYTWGKALADISSFSQQGDQGWSNANPNKIRQIEYGKSDDDIQNRFALSLNYEEQFGKEFTGIKKAVLSGWNTNMILVWQSGKPFSIVSSGAGADDPIGDNPGAPNVAYGFNNRAVPLNGGGLDRPNQIANAQISHKTLSHFFNTAAFAPQTLGTVGDVQRNSMFGPDFRHVDLSLFKTFPVTERVNVQFRVESFNLSNTPSFYMPNTNSPGQSFGNAGFGTISNADPNYTPRELQFALKAMF